MPLFVALLVWFVLSIPASLILGRLLAGATDGPVPAPPVPSSRRELVLN